MSNSLNNTDVVCAQSRSEAPTRSKYHVSIISKHKKADFKVNKHRKMVLYISPHLDKCNSNIYLPSLIAKLSNGLDFESLRNALTSRSTDDCVLEVRKFDKNIYHASTMFLSLIQYLSERHPDVIFHSKNIKVLGNQIRSTLSLKLTDNEKLNEAVNRSKRWEMFHNMNKDFPTDRANKYLHMMDLKRKSQQEIREIEKIVHSHNDLQVCGHWDMLLTVDSITDKIKRIELSPRITSIQALVEDTA